MKKLILSTFILLGVSAFAMAQTAPAKTDSKPKQKVESKAKAAKPVSNPSTAVINKTPEKKAVTTNSKPAEKPKKEAVEKKAAPTTAGPVKKDGTPDKRYSANKNLKKDGTPDKRFKENKKKN